MIVPFWKSAFPKLLSYNRFIEIMPRCLQALSSFFHQVKGKDTGISIIDSTKLVVCHNLRIKRHRVFKGLAGRGKSSTGWFYGFKLHLIINNLGEIINLTLTSGNVHDVAVLESLTKELKGILLGDFEQSKTKCSQKNIDSITQEYEKINLFILNKKNNCFAKED